MFVCQGVRIKNNFSSNRILFIHFWVVLRKNSFQINKIINSDFMALMLPSLIQMYSNKISLNETLVLSLIDEPCSGNNKSLVLPNSNNFIYVHICIWWCGSMHKIYFHTIHYGFFVSHCAYPLQLVYICAIWEIKFIWIKKILKRLIANWL